MIRGLVALLASAGVALSAQAPRPSRPALGAGEDTNSADAYVMLGISQMPDHPKVAAAAFFWATRLDPANADAWYGRWAAHLLDPDTPPSGGVTLPGGVDIDAPETHDPDSLRSKALLRNPLVFVRFDFPVADQLMRRQSRGRMSLFQTDDPSLRAEIDYSIGRFSEAIRSLGRALHAHPGDYRLRLDRARAFAMLTQFDSAVNELDQYLRATRGITDRGPHAPDIAPEMVTYLKARLEEERGREGLGVARALYDSILAGHPGWVMAHAGLSRVAMALGDTATAVAEMGRAAAVPDAPICYDYALLLTEAGRTPEAAVQLRRAIAVDSDYSKPYYLLGLMEQQAGFDSEAVELYSRFIAGAPRALAVSVEDARGRLARLQGVARQH